MSRTAWFYTALAYGITWILLFFALWLFKNGAITEDQLQLLHISGAFGPFIAAIITIRYCYGKAGLKKLFSKFKGFNYTVLWLISTPIILFLAGYLLYPIITGKWFSFEITKEQFHLTTPIAYWGWALPFITYAFFEEVGWRGFLLPHLQEKHTAFQATVILSIIWALWHIPMFFSRFDFSPVIAIGFFFGLFVGTIILTAIFNISQGSLWAVILFHFNNNIASAFEQNYIVAIISTGLVFLAIYLLRRYKLQDLADTNRIGNYFLQ